MFRLLPAYPARPLRKAKMLSFCSSKEEGSAPSIRTGNASIVTRNFGDSVFVPKGTGAIDTLVS
jgi:hypothetical protein